MIVTRPHYLLFCDGSLTSASASSTGRPACGRWRFVLEDVQGGEKMEASDAEISSAPDRLALLAVVRGLEALSQPSRVTLVTTSRYVYRGLQYGLPEWRETDYCWEHFGAVQQIRNADLWQRIDHALDFHVIHCRLMAADETENHTEVTAIEKVEPFDPADRNGPIFSVADMDTVASPELAEVAAAHSQTRRENPPLSRHHGDLERLSLLELVSMWLQHRTSSGFQRIRTAGAWMVAMIQTRKKLWLRQRLSFGSI